MRESRTYGSVRGACDETHVPTATRRDVAYWHDPGEPITAAYVRGVKRSCQLRARNDANDQLGHLANNFAVMHNSVLTQQCGNVRPLA